jgi:hypothetical protein
MDKICFACDKPINIRYSAKFANGVGIQTIRLTTYDKDWAEVNKEVYFHDECFYFGFMEAVKRGYQSSKQFERDQNR